MDVKQLIINGLDNAKRMTDKALDGLTSDELRWQPRSDANSIGLILFHMARFEDSFVQSVIQHKPTLWESEKWCDKLEKEKTDTGSHYSAEQVAGFCVPHLPDLQEYHGAVRKKTIEFIQTLTSEMLDKKVDLPPFGPPPAPGQPPRRPPFEPIVGFLLMMTVTHLAEHAGEISYIRGLKRGMDK